MCLNLLCGNLQQVDCYLIVSENSNQNQSINGSFSILDSRLDLPMDREFIVIIVLSYRSVTAESCAVLFQFSIRRVCHQCCHSVHRDLRIWTFAGESKPRSTRVSSVQVHLHTSPDRLRAFGRGSSTCYLSEVIINHWCCSIFDLPIKYKLIAKYSVVQCGCTWSFSVVLFYCCIAGYRCFVVLLLYVSKFFCRH